MRFRIVKIAVVDLPTTSSQVMTVTISKRDSDRASDMVNVACHVDLSGVLPDDGLDTGSVVSYLARRLGRDAVRAATARGWGLCGRDTADEEELYVENAVRAAIRYGCTHPTAARIIRRIPYGAFILGQEPVPMVDVIEIDMSGLALFRLNNENEDHGIRFRRYERTPRQIEYDPEAD